MARLATTPSESSLRMRTEPHDQPWGERMARVADPDGNRVIIGSRLAGG